MNTKTDNTSSPANVSNSSPSGEVPHTQAELSAPPL